MLAKNIAKIGAGARIRIKVKLKIKTQEKTSKIGLKKSLLLLKDFIRLSASLFSAKFIKKLY